MDKRAYFKLMGLQKKALKLPKLSPKLSLLQKLSPRAKKAVQLQALRKAVPIDRLSQIAKVQSRVDLGPHGERLPALRLSNGVLKGDFIPLKRQFEKGPRYFGLYWPEGISPTIYPKGYDGLRRVPTFQWRGWGTGKGTGQEIADNLNRVTDYLGGLLKKRKSDIFVQHGLRNLAESLKTLKQYGINLH